MRINGTKRTRHRALLTTNAFFGIDFRDAECSVHGACARRTHRSARGVGARITANHEGFSKSFIPHYCYPRNDFTAFSFMVQ
jgi:hypothetical protein